MAELAAPSFGTRAAAAIAEHGPLCVGIDAHPSLLEAWGLPQTPAGLLRFSLGVVEALEGRVAAIKPQVALYERHGFGKVGEYDYPVGAWRDREFIFRRGALSS